MIRIKNKNTLIKNGKTKLARKARKLAIRSLECALAAANPKKLLKTKLSLTGSSLQVDGILYDLTMYKNIYVIGGGKASGAMAEALEKTLCKHITTGTINVPYGTKPEISIIKPHQANHPIPDQAGIEGTKRMMEIAEQAEKNDLVICLISGGGSSLMPLPREGVSLEDKRTLTETLLKCGATINEINVVRKHLSAFKGGWLAKKAYPATVLSLILSDVVGDPLEAIASGPTFPDPSTFADAKKVLKKYALWSTVPPGIRKILSDGIKGRIEETPKPGDPTFEKVSNVIVGNNLIACQAAAEYLKSKGLNTLVCADTLEGEAREAGKALAALAIKIAASGKSLPKPTGIIAGGETTVTVVGKGLGGRNQELALSAMMQLGEVDGCAIACLSTDGIDGPTNAAGAIADSETLARAAELGIEAKKFLAQNDSYHFFLKLGELICTGQTGTNVNDISVIVVV